MSIFDIFKKASSNYKSKYLYKFIKPKKMGNRIYSLLFLIYFIILIVFLFINQMYKTSILLALLAVFVFIILLCFLILIVTYGACLIFEVPRIIIYEGIEDIVTLIESCFTNDFYKLNNHISSFSEHIKCYNVANIPSDNYTLDFYAYKLKSKNIKLLIVIPIAATLLWQSLKYSYIIIIGIFPKVNELIISLHNFLIDNEIIFNSNFINLFALAFFLVIYHGEIERIQQKILLIDLLKQVNTLLKTKTTI